MKRNKKKRRGSIKRADRLPESAALPRDKSKSRRETLLAMRNWAVLGAAGLGIGWYIVDEVTASIAEHDLSRIGNGKMAVVQVHDPQCPRCRALQRETRRALKRLNHPSVQYLVANIKTSSGRRFAAEHSVGHITLVLLDGAGRRQGILRGNRNSQSLYEGFRLYFGLSNEQS